MEVALLRVHDLAGLNEGLGNGAGGLLQGRGLRLPFQENAVYFLDVLQGRVRAVVGTLHFLLSPHHVLPAQLQPQLGLSLLHLAQSLEIQPWDLVAEVLVLCAAGYHREEGIRTQLVILLDVYLDLHRGFAHVGEVAFDGEIFGDVYFVEELE